MLAKCLNPACDARFRYLNQGRIFNIEIPFTLSPSKSTFAKMERFWLCEQCCREMKVIVENGTVTTVPLEPSEIVANLEESEEISTD